MIKRAYKTELDPTVAQRRMLAQHVAGARVAHNWVLEQWVEHDALRQLASGLRAISHPDANGLAAARWLSQGLSSLYRGKRQPADKPLLAEGAAAANAIEYALAALIGGTPVEVRTPSAELDGDKCTLSAAVVSGLLALYGRRAAVSAVPKHRVRYRAPTTAMVPDFAPSSIDWYSRLAFLRKEQPERFGWLDELSSFAVREAVLDVADGWKHFFEHLKAGRYERAGRPRFRNWRAARYHTDQPDPIRVTDRAIKIPGVGWVRLKERGYLPTTEEKSHRFIGGGKAYGLGFSEVDGRWYVSLRCETPTPLPKKRGPGRALREHPTPRIPGRRAGVEVGVRVLGVAYDGESSSTVVDVGLRDDARIGGFERLRKLWERRMARRWKSGVKTRDQSKGWKEASRRVAHYHARIVHLRDDRCGKLIRRIVDSGAEVVALREPSIAAMLDRRQAKDARKRNALAPLVHNARMGEIRQRLEYKMVWAGGKVELVNRYEPTSKRCSECGAERKLDPGYPNFKCPICGHIEDRDDANSAKNLYNHRTPSGDPEASPRSADSKHSSQDEDNGRRKRTARTSESQDLQVTAPHRPGNRARPGAPHLVGPIESHHDNTLERSSDDNIESEEVRIDTATVLADEENRSQTGSQVGEIALIARGGSGAIS